MDGYYDNIHSNRNIPGAPNISEQFTPSSSMRFVDELPSIYQSLFPDFRAFNSIQSQLMDHILCDDSSIVVSAPTGSGKTTLFELAIIRLLENNRAQDRSVVDLKIVYMAPVKALCSERYTDWESKFLRLGLKAIQVTGDSDEGNLLAIQHFNLVLTTPEKWDALTRKWRDHASLVSVIRLFLIDEVHLLNEDKRGSTLEAVVSRMKTVQESDPHSNQIRFIAVSATIPNIEDVALWLGKKNRPAKFFKFGEEMRPVKLRKIVKAFPFVHGMSYFKFDFNLSYKLRQIILDYSEGKPTLGTSSMRQSSEIWRLIPERALALRRASAALGLIGRQENYLYPVETDMIRHGVGFHHAGLVTADRHYVEELFRSGFLPVLVCTSTLAMGVNLPAHLVVIKSTGQYSNGGWEEYSEGQLLQMMGRAGRPQFDTSATAVILTKSSLKEKYEKLFLGNQVVESNLHKNLAEHLNSEIVLGTITDIAVAVSWLRSTFFYVRARQNPKYYGIPLGLPAAEMEARLQAMCMRELNGLERYELIKKTDYAYNVEPTENGRLMARLYIAYETMKIFMKIKGTESLCELIELLCSCKEFADLQLRVNERAALNYLNSGKDHETIRFPLSGKIKTKEMKVNCLVQAVLGCLPISDPSLAQEANRVLRLFERVSKAVALYLWQKNFYCSLASSLTLAKCLSVRLWENSIFATRHLPGIGPTSAALLAQARKTSFQDVIEANPRDLERILNKHPPFGNNLQEAAKSIPQYSIATEFSHYMRKLFVKLRLLNADYIHDVNRTTSLLISDSNNMILRKEKIRDGALVEHNGQYEVTVPVAVGVTWFIVHLISDVLVGVDIKKKIAPSFKGVVDINNYTHFNAVPYEDESDSAKLPEAKEVAKETRRKSATGQKMVPPPSRATPSNSKRKTPGVIDKLQTQLDQYAFKPSRGKKLLHTPSSAVWSETEVSSTQDQPPLPGQCRRPSPSTRTASPPSEFDLNQLCESVEDNYQKRQEPSGSSSSNLSYPESGYYSIPSKPPSAASSKVSLDPMKMNDPSFQKRNSDAIFEHRDHAKSIPGQRQPSFTPVNKTSTNEHNIPILEQYSLSPTTSSSHCYNEVIDMCGDPRNYDARVEQSKKISLGHSNVPEQEYSGQMQCSDVKVPSDQLNPVGLNRRNQWSYPQNSSTNPRTRKALFPETSHSESLHPELSQRFDSDSLSASGSVKQGVRLTVGCSSAKMPFKEIPEYSEQLRCSDGRGPKCELGIQEFSEKNKSTESVNSKHAPFPHSSHFAGNVCPETFPRFNSNEGSCRDSEQMMQLRRQTTVKIPSREFIHSEKYSSYFSQEEPTEDLSQHSLVNPKKVPALKSSYSKSINKYETSSQGQNTDEVTTCVPLELHNESLASTSKFDLKPLQTKQMLIEKNYDYNDEINSQSVKNVKHSNRNVNFEDVSREQTENSDKSGNSRVRMAFLISPEEITSSSSKSPHPTIPGSRVKNRLAPIFLPLGSSKEPRSELAVDPAMSLEKSSLQPETELPENNRDRMKSPTKDLDPSKDINNTQDEPPEKKPSEFENDANKQVTVNCLTSPDQAHHSALIKFPAENASTAYENLIPNNVLNDKKQVYGSQNSSCKTGVEPEGGPREEEVSGAVREERKRRRPDSSYDAWLEDSQESLIESDGVILTKAGVSGLTNKPTSPSAKLTNESPVGVDDLFMDSSDSPKVDEWKPKELDYPKTESIPRLPEKKNNNSRTQRRNTENFYTEIRPANATATSSQNTSQGNQPPGRGFSSDARLSSADKDEDRSNEVFHSSKLRNEYGDPFAPIHEAAPPDKNRANASSFHTLPTKPISYQSQSQFPLRNNQQQHDELNSFKSVSRPTSVQAVTQPSYINVPHNKNIVQRNVSVNDGRSMKQYCPSVKNLCERNSVSNMNADEDCYRVLRDVSNTQPSVSSSSNSARNERNQAYQLQNVPAARQRFQISDNLSQNNGNFKKLKLESNMFIPTRRAVKKTPIARNEVYSRLSDLAFGGPRGSVEHRVSMPASTGSPAVFQPNVRPSNSFGSKTSSKNSWSFRGASQSQQAVNQPLVFDHQMSSQPIFPHQRSSQPLRSQQPHQTPFSPSQVFSQLHQRNTSYMPTFQSSFRIPVGSYDSSPQFSFQPQGTPHESYAPQQNVFHFPPQPITEAGNTHQQQRLASHFLDESQVFRPLPRRLAAMEEDDSPPPEFPPEELSSDEMADQEVFHYTQMNQPIHEMSPSPPLDGEYFENVLNSRRVPATHEDLYFSEEENSE